MGDVLKFTGKHKVEGTPQTPEDVQKLYEDRKTQAIERAVDMAAASAISALNSVGFTIGNPFDIGLFTEVLKSSIRRSIGEFHPLQLVADEVVVMVQDDGKKISSDGTPYIEKATHVDTRPEPSSNSEFS